MSQQKLLPPPLDEDDEVVTKLKKMGDEYCKQVNTNDAKTNDAREVGTNDAREVERCLRLIKMFKEKHY